MKAKLKIAGAVLIGVTSVLLIWGVAIEPRLIDEVHLDAPIPNLPPDWHGAQVAFIADIQVGMWLGNEDTVRRMVRRIVQRQPAAVLIGGDFIYHPLEDDTPAEALEEYEREDAAETVAEVQRVTRMLAPLVRGGLSVYAVLGNHDYAMSTHGSLKSRWVAERLKKSLEETGIQVLHNESVAMNRLEANAATTHEPLNLVGIGPHYPDEAKVARALADLPEGAPRILLMHNPQTFEEVPAGQGPLTLAGHTHGGQVRIPFLPAWSWLSIVAGREVHTDGWIRDFGLEGNRLYVNRGIGFSSVPVRINCRPELTWITLRSSNR